MSKKMCIGVLFGGQSSEHDVSCVSAQYVIQNIDRDKYDIVMIGITLEGIWYHYNGPVEKISTGEWKNYTLEDIDTKNSYIEFENNSIFNRVVSNGLDKKIDVVFPVLHGINGEDGTVQGFLELAQIPYVGCNVISSAVGMDKCMAKIIFEKAKIPQADYLIVNRFDLDSNSDSIMDNIESKFDYPVFVKPSNAGSSVGVSKSHNRDELKKGLEEAAFYDRKILVEEFIKGKEVECAILGNEKPLASTVGEIIPANEFYDYEAKYSNAESETLIPAKITDNVKKKIQKYAIEAFKALDCSGLSRVDFFVTDSDDIVLNEINTLPGFTSISMYAKLWDASGVEYKNLVEKLINMAFERFEYCKRKLI